MHRVLVEESSKVAGRSLRLLEVQDSRCYGEVVETKSSPEALASASVVLGKTC